MPSSSPKVSPYHWYWELPIPRITDTQSHQLPESPIRRVDDSPYHLCGEFHFKRFSSHTTPHIRNSTNLRYGELANPHIANIGESIFDLRISWWVRSQNRKSFNCCVRDLCQTDLYKKIEKSVSLPCPIKYAKIFLKNGNFLETQFCKLSTEFTKGREISLFREKGKSHFRFNLRLELLAEQFLNNKPTYSFLQTCPQPDILHNSLSAIAL
jgi:hypothetical protein